MLVRVIKRKWALIALSSWSFYNWLLIRNLFMITLWLSSWSCIRNHMQTSILLTSLHPGFIHSPVYYHLFLYLILKWLSSYLISTYHWHFWDYLFSHLRCPWELSRESELLLLWSLDHKPANQWHSHWLFGLIMTIVVIFVTFNPMLQLIPNSQQLNFLTAHWTLT